MGNKKIYLRRGDWLVDKKEPTFVAQVIDITDLVVVCDCISFPVTQLNEYRCWNLLDAKEGEVLVKNNQDSSRTIFIYGGITKKNREFFIDYHYRVDIDGDICIHGINKGDTIGPLSTNVVPACGTESRILYSRFLNDRLRYNPHTHTISKIELKDKKKEKVMKHFNRAWQ